MPYLHLHHLSKHAHRQGKARPGLQQERGPWQTFEITEHLIRHKTSCHNVRMSSESDGKGCQRVADIFETILLGHCGVGREGGSTTVSPQLAHQYVNMAKRPWQNIWNK